MTKFEILHGPMLSGCGTPIVIRVSLEAEAPIIAVEWYLLVRSHQDAIGYRATHTLRVDTSANTDDPTNPKQLTAEWARDEAMNEVQRSLANYRASLAKEPVHYPDVEFIVATPEYLQAMLMGGAGRKELEHIHEITASNDLRQFIFNILHTTPKRPISTSPYPEEPKPDPDLRTS